MREKLIALIKKTKLKYNYFSMTHPDKALKGRLFKFLDNNRVQFLKNKEIKIVKDSDLEQEGKKLYSPVDMS